MTPALKARVQQRQRELGLPVGAFLGALTAALEQDSPGVIQAIDAGKLRFRLELAWPQFELRVHLENPTTGESAMVAGPESPKAKKSRAALN